MPFLRGLTTDPRYLQVPLCLHRFEQQSELDEQLLPRGTQDGQAGSPLQPESLQSGLPSQSLSVPSVQLVSEPSGAPQSAAQLHMSSPIPGSQITSPHRSAPQSITQLALVSVPSHTRSPQHVLPPAGVDVQVFPLAAQRESLQPTGDWPSPSPQQYRLFGLPCLPLQSPGQLRQSSPSAVSQISFPQTAPPLNDRQSSAQLLQSSPDSHVPSLSHVGQPPQSL